MKRLRSFAYHEPASLEDAIEALAGSGPEARVLAGGTDLLVDIKMDRVRAGTVVNIKRIAGLDGIEQTPAGTRIGALTRVTAIQHSALLRRLYPGLAAAASVLASPPVRALATIGGNVGRASPASDLGPALIVHEAMAEIAGPDGVRTEAVEHLYAGPGTTTLAPAEIITFFVVPIPGTRFGSAHVKLGKRGSGTDIAIAAVSAACTVSADGVVDECRVALASVAPRPVRASSVEAALLGRGGSDDDLGRAAAAVCDDISPIDDVRSSAEYRRHVAPALTLKALRQAYAIAAGERNS
jgi:CO/xanthine dehydrogenase FAD-binding subunit